VAGFPRSIAWLAVGLAALAWAGAEPAARAQEDDDQRVLILTNEAFDHVMFSGRVNAPEARARLDFLLAQRILELDQACQLTEAQTNKLTLAGRGDIGRLFDRIDEKRAQLVGRSIGLEVRAHILQQLQPLQASYSTGVFGDESMFQKATRRLLTENQLARYDRFLEGRRASEYRAKVDMVAANLGTALGLSMDQRRRFVNVLIEETRPPREIGTYDYQAVMLQAARVPGDKIKPIFGDAQWQVLSQQLAGAVAMEGAIRAHGYVADEAPAPPIAVRQGVKRSGGE
jgi:hypothetical protein